MSVSPSKDSARQTSPRPSRATRMSTRLLRATDWQLLASHKLVVSLYIAIALIASASVLFLPDILFAIYEIAAGTSVTWGFIIFPYYVYIITAVIIVLLQGAILFGAGTVQLGHARRRSSLTMLSFLALSAVATLLAVSALFLLQTAGDAAHDVAAFGLFHARPDLTPNTIGEPAFSELTALAVILSIWALWTVLGLIYLRGDDSFSRVHRVIRILLATSWIGFGLALPLYLASRDNDKNCPCAFSSYYGMLTILIACVILFGPGLYLFYLKESKLSKLQPTRARNILQRKSTISDDANEIKNDNYISNARTMSLITIALGFLGLELGIFNEQRGTLFADIRKTVLINNLSGKFHDNETLLHFVESPSGGTLSDTAFGNIKIKIAEQSSAEADYYQFNAEVTGSYEVWRLSRFNLDSSMSLNRLEKIFDDLDIKENLHGSELITSLRRKLYNREVKIPGADFWGFNTSAAGWIIAVLSTSLLIALRGALRQIPHGSDGGIAEPWLVLDAKAGREQAVAAAWRGSAAWSGWLANFGLIISTESQYILREGGTNIAEVVTIYLSFMVLLSVNTGTALQILAEIRRVRGIRLLVRQTTQTKQASAT
jgi:hypothetical protein